MTKPITKLAAISFLLVFAGFANALNDINITIESANTALCISDDTLTDQTCNTSVDLVLDGSMDHMLYFTYEQPIDQNASNSEIALYGVTHSLSFLLAFGPLLLFVLLALGGVTVVYLFFKVILGR